MESIFESNNDFVVLEIKTLINIFEVYGDKTYVGEYIKELKDYDKLGFSKLLYILKQLQEYCRYDSGWEDEFRKIEDLSEKLKAIESEREIVEKEEEPINKFWVSLKAWIDDELPCKGILYERYIEYDNWNGGTYYCTINYDDVFRLYLGISYNNEYEDKNKCKFCDIKLLIELLYKELIKSDMRYSFTIEINNRLSKFQLPYELKNGKIIKKGYKGTTENKSIINYQMLEAKILWAEDRIMGKELLDKHTALNYITDSLEYLFSLINSFTFDPYKKKPLDQKCGLLVSCDDNSKIYTVIKAEVNQIHLIVNEYFDIRHNEYLSKVSKSKRDALINPAIIEYLFNRIYALLVLLKNMYLNENRKQNEILSNT